jgi:hypothetical protein
MNSVSKKFVPVALWGLLTSSLLYGCIPYTVTSVQGGPVSDAIGSVISFAEAQLSEDLSFEAIVVDVQNSAHSSFWLKEDSDEDKFPRGSKIVVVKFAVHNNSEKPIDVYRLFVKAWFEGTDNLAAPVIPTQEAPHVKLGYPEYLIDLFGSSTDSWIIPAGESLVFAESFHVEGNSELNVSIITPEQDKAKEGKSTSEIFKLVV